MQRKGKGSPGGSRLTYFKPKQKRGLCTGKRVIYNQCVQLNWEEIEDTAEGEGTIYSLWKEVSRLLDWENKDRVSNGQLKRKGDTS